MKRYAALFAFVVAIAGCSATSSSSTQTLQGTFEAANTRQLQVRMAEPGQLVSDKIMPMDPKVKVVIDGKASTLQKLVIGQTITVTRNPDTKRVVRIEAQ
jgi:PBP1b-binding outer membrane lipoprotein LpoB